MFQNPLKYTPSRSIQGIFEGIVRQPIENHPRTPAWEREVLSPNSADIYYRHTYHRDTILEKGSTNFDEEFKGLTPEDKVLLYCAYYMPMHLASSYCVYRVHEQAFTSLFTSVSSQAVFIDFGSGPLTSGLALWELFYRELNTIYLGVEASRAMREKAREINQYGPSQYGNPFFNSLELICDFRTLPELLDNIITEDNKNPIIFNFCYFLANPNYNITDLSDVMVRIVEKHKERNMCIVYQNPTPSRFHENWEILKTYLSGFRTITQSNVLTFCYERLTETRSQTLSVYYDILCNW